VVGRLGFDDKPARLGLGLIPYTGRVKRRPGPERSGKSDSKISRHAGRDSLQPVDSKLTLTSTNSGMVWKGAALPRRGRSAARATRRGGAPAQGRPASHKTRVPTDLSGHFQTPGVPWLERTHQSEQLTHSDVFSSSISLGGRPLGLSVMSAKTGQKKTIRRKDTVSSDRCLPTAPPISCESPRDGLRRGTLGPVRVPLFGGSGDHPIL